MERILTKDTIYKYLSTFLVITAVAVLIYEVLPLLRSHITKQQFYDVLKIPGLLLIGSVVIKAMIPGEIPYISNVFHLLEGLPIVLLVLSIIILVVYMKIEKESYFDVFKFIFGSFVGSVIQKNTSRKVIGDT